MDRLTTLGQTVATPSALVALADADQTPLPYLTRHIGGDYGDMPAEDQAANRAGPGSNWGRPCCTGRGRCPNWKDRTR